MIELRGKHIAVLKGGPSSERAVSLATGAGIARALRSLGAEITEVQALEAYAILIELNRLRLRSIPPRER